MGLRIYISSNNGNKEINNAQHRILMILKSLGMELEVVDISAPGTEKERDYMREHGKKKEGFRNVLPPQIFNGEKYCGDYEDFDIANEDDVLEEFLGIPRKNPKVEPEKTDAVAGEPGKLPEPGKPEGETAAEGEAAPATEAPAATEAAPVEAAPVEAAA
jgi:glutaredoxin